jgi:hypothetical protein
VCKVRGITLNYSASKHVNFDAIRDMILWGNESEGITVDTEYKIKWKKAVGRRYTITEPEDKMYRVTFFKRRRIADNTSVPFGYINERWDVVTSVMSHDRRFKHPISFIIAGRVASGKSSFCIKILQNLKSLCTKHEYADGILWCYGARTLNDLLSPSRDSRSSITSECLKTLRTKEATLLY